MTLARFSFGIVLAAVALTPVAWGSHRIRQRILPSWCGAAAGLCDVVIGLCVTVVTCELLGTVGRFDTASVVIGLALVGLASAVLAGHRPTPQTHRDESLPTVPRTQSIAAGIVVAILVGSWTSRTARAIGRGMETIDTLWYHLPVAARFVQTGHTMPIHYVDSDPITAFYPASSSLLHGLGILLFRTDLVSTLINLGWLALGLVAAWCVGKPFRVAPLTLVGAALLFATPGLVATQPGGGYTDTMGLALILVSAALLVQHPGEPRTPAQDLLVALAGGLAVGTKFTFVGPVAALAVVQIVTAPKGRRLTHTACVVGGITLSGGYWYLRNLLAAGNPLPPLNLRVGGIGFPTVHAATPTSSVAHFLFDADAWGTYFVPGLRSSLGPAWPAIVAFAVLGMVAGAVGRQRSARVRGLALVAGASLVMFILTPQYLLLFGRPFFFVFNLRYAGPAFVLGLVVLPLAWAGRRRWSTWLFAGYLMAFALTEVDPGSWPTGVPWAAFQDRASLSDAWWGIAVAVIIMLVWIARASHRSWAIAWSSARMAGAATVAIVMMLLLVHNRSLRGRYADTAPYPETYAWAGNIHSARIAVSGVLTQLQYPFYGRSLSNFVQFAGVAGANGNFRPIATCREWSRFLHDGRYNYVVIAPPTVSEQSSHEDAWTLAQPGAKLVKAETTRATNNLAHGAITVRTYHLDPSRPPASC